MNESPETKTMYCCDSCVRHHGLNPKSPADSSNASHLCMACSRYGIGSLMICKIGERLQVIPIKPALGGQS